MLRNTILLLFISTAGLAQISGKVVDAATSKPLFVANVFFNKTDVGTTTNDEGEFALKSKQQGTFELIISYIGYETYKVQVRAVPGTELNLGIIRLQPNATELASIEVKASRDKLWERQVKDFKKIFIGEDENSIHCEILNPWVLDFPKDSIEHKFVATANAPIEIKNLALGYKVFYYLDGFWADAHLGFTSSYQITGTTRFEELTPSDVNQAARWIKNRENAYAKSFDHLFKSILDGRIKANGYKISYQDTTKKFINVVWLKLDSSGIVSNSEYPGEYQIRMHGLYQIEKNRRSTSQINIASERVTVNRNGFPLNPEKIVVSGEYDNNRVSSLLPTSYQPIEHTNDPFRRGGQRKALSITSKEKIYVHLDKPYYYPGETIWFKGYVKFDNPAIDSLSGVVYAELIDPHDRVVLAKTLKIDSGSFYNDFVLSDTLQRGNYYLRAYTNFDRNFGDENLFAKPLFILNAGEKVDPSQQTWREVSDGHLRLTSDKRTYKPRERITLTLQTKDQTRNLSGANLSVAVTDAIEVVAGTPPFTIKEYFAPDREQKVFDFTYLVEGGISFSAQYFNKKGKPEKAALNVIHMGSPLTLKETDTEGKFSFRNLQFYDSLDFFIKSENAKDFTGVVKLVGREIPPIKINKTDFFPKISKTELPGKDIQNDSKLLKEVTVTGRKIERHPEDGGFNGYVIRNSELNKSNVLINLMHLDGNHFQVDMLTSEIKVYSAGGWHLLPVLINGQLVFPIAQGGARLESLYAGDINAIYVSRTSVEVYTKGGVERGTEVKHNFQLIRVPGYFRAHKFESPDYSDPKTDKTLADNRSTIYWNPKVRISKEGTSVLSFFAADLPGHYQIVVEGINQLGEPVRSVSFIEINDD